MIDELYLFFLTNSSCRIIKNFVIYYVVVIEENMINKMAEVLVALPG